MEALYGSSSRFGLVSRGPQTRNGSLRAGEAAADEPNLLGPWLDECTAPQVPGTCVKGSMQAFVHQLHKLHCSILN